MRVGPVGGGVTTGRTEWNRDGRVCWMDGVTRRYMAETTRVVVCRDRWVERVGGRVKDEVSECKGGRWRPCGEGRKSAGETRQACSGLQSNNVQRAWVGSCVHGTLTAPLRPQCCGHRRQSTVDNWTVVGSSAQLLAAYVGGYGRGRPALEPPNRTKCPPKQARQATHTRPRGRRDQLATCSPLASGFAKFVNGACPFSRI